MELLLNHFERAMMVNRVPEIQTGPKKVSIISPCYNEAGYIEDFLKELEGQDYPKSSVEFLIVDGGSNDGTDLKIKNFITENPSFKLLTNPLRTAPYAMNMAIKESTGDIIIRMDVHASYPKSYIRVLVDKLESSKGIGNVGCILKTAPANEKAVSKGIAYAMSTHLGVGGAKFRVGVDKDTLVDTVPFGCFRKELFRDVGFYNEKLTRSQDYEFNSRIREKGYGILLTPDISVTYYSRSTYQKLISMHFQSAYTKVLSNVLMKNFNGYRQFIPPAFISVLVVLFLVGLFSPLALGLCGLLFGTYLGTVVLYSFGVLFKKEPFDVILHMIVSMVTMHFSYAAGYCMGVFDFILRGKKFIPKDLKITR